MMYNVIRDKALAFWETFHGSATIIWARSQVLLGALYFGYTMIDPHDIGGLDPRYVQAWIVGNGVLAEYLRRRNAEYHDDGNIK